MEIPQNKWSYEEESMYIVEFLYKYKLIHSEENIIVCPKAFMVNSILQCCFRIARRETMSKQKWIRNLRIVNNYISGTVDIVWKEGKFEVHKK